MYSGIAEVAALTGNKPYEEVIDSIWTDVVNDKLYITGGIGATGDGEAFGGPYELPNMSAYAETCAAVANIFWNNRMFLLHGDAKYIDVLERTLYNGLLSGVSLNGTRFFYPNPLASMGAAPAQRVVRLRVLHFQHGALPAVHAGIHFCEKRERSVCESFCGLYCRCAAHFRDDGRAFAD